MQSSDKPVAVVAAEAPLRTKPTNYPEPFASRMAGRRKQPLGDLLEGHPTLHTDEGRTRLSPGMCAGFKAGSGNADRLVNETNEDVLYLEVGDRTPGDEGSYPDDDLKAMLVDGKWQFVHKDGSPY